MITEKRVYEYITWLHEPEKYSYLRESTSVTCDPNEIPKLENDDWLLVGYENYARDYDGIYFRRYWWLKNYDRDIDPNGVYATGQPAEAVAIEDIISG